MEKLQGLRKEFENWYKEREKKGYIPLYAIEYWWLKKINKLINNKDKDI